MKNIFFYGLFMDRALLTDQGLNPRMVGMAVLHDYRLHIGDRATLLPAPSGRAYGVVMELTHAEARRLYAEPSVREYLPEPVRPELLASGDSVEAECYNLPRHLALAGTNPDYAAKLARLAQDLGLHPGYVQEIASFRRS